MKKRTWKQKLKQCLLKKWKKAAGACTKVRENPSFKGAIWMSILLINLLLETTLSNIANQFTMELISILKMFFKYSSPIGNSELNRLSSDADASGIRV